jgi:hypothetical protein
MAEWQHRRLDLSDLPRVADQPRTRRPGPSMMGADAAATIKASGDHGNPN